MKEVGLPWLITEERKLLKILKLQKEKPDWKKISNLLKKVNVDKLPRQFYRKWYTIKDKEEYKFNFDTKKIEF